MNGEETVLRLAPRLTERQYNLQYVGTLKSEAPLTQQCYSGTV